MSTDGLIFRFLSRVNKRTKVPLIGTLVSEDNLRIRLDSLI